MVQKKSLKWYPIPEYENFYKINKIGQVFSIKNNRILIPSTHYKSEYKSVQLCVNGKVIRFNIHLLMAKTFINKNYTEQKLCCKHINGKKEDNRLKNLKLITYLENSEYARKTRLLKKKLFPIKGKNHGLPILTESQVKKIYLLYKQGNCSGKKLANRYNVSSTTIYDITNRKSWKHVTKDL